MSKLRKIVFGVLFIILALTGIIIENSPLQRRFHFKDANTYLKRKLERKAEIQKAILGNQDMVRMVDQFDVESELYKEIKDNNLAVFAYKHQCLVFWSDNHIHPFNFTTDRTFKSNVLYNESGWYQMISIKYGDYDLYCYYRFYEQYPFNNEYFVDRFSPDIKLNDIKIRPPDEPNENRDISGFQSFSSAPEVDGRSFSERRLTQLLEFIYVLAVLFFLIFAGLNAESEGQFNLRRFFILFSLFIAITNLLAFFDIILKHKSESPLFSPELAAYSEFIPSLGHCILLAMAILAMMLTLHQMQPYLPFKRKPGLVSYLLISVVIWGTIYFLFIRLIPVYILNSQINYDFKTLANVNQYSLLGMFTVFIMFIVLVLVTRICSGMALHNFDRKKFYLGFVSISAILSLVLYFVEKENGFLLICFALFGLIWVRLVLLPDKFQFSYILASSLVCAAFLAVQFEQLSSFKEKEHRKLFANKLVSKEDIDNDFRLLNVEKEMVRSSAFDSFYYFNGPDQNELELNDKYTFFNSFIKNFDIDFMKFDSTGNDLAQNKLTYETVNSIYNKSTNKTITNYFLFIKDLHYLGGYLAKYEICPADKTLGYVFIMMVPKVKSDLYNLDYFFSKIDYNHLAENRYSYAIYQKNELVKGLGAYPFKLSDNIQYKTLEDVSFFEQNGYSQLFKKIDDDTFIIVSLKADTWNKKFTEFTFILLYFTGIIIICYIVLYLIILFIRLLSFSKVFANLHEVVTGYLRVININKLYLETRIRLSFLMISILICSVVIYFTVQNVNRSFKEKQNDNLDKKMSQILNELEMGYQRKDQGPVQNLIKHLAGTYEVDINIYQKDGTLYQTANNRIYYEGWFNPYIHPNAHYELIEKKQYSIKQVEKIGNLVYQSYYTSLFDENRNLIGYVHLPYFSKSLDLKNEFSNYLGSLLNISTLLLMISLLISSYIGRSLVKPLKLMIDSLARIRLGEHNKAIDWNGNDEIGQLVHQYNIMLNKLEVSTELLAQSEREGAWKEMAKQVAHEIKNPLTPMKLHLQHLQMSINRDDDGLKDKVSNISRILIEQIDHLSRMAEEFSSFAKMPMAVPETCNLYETLSSCITLFRAQNDMEISFESNDRDIPVYIDNGQMQRVFTNILKNAVQAARENELCRIAIKIEKRSNDVMVSFADNGKGIEEELKEKIFHPNFSTKNSGMGLGLAICKKILEQVNGEISFTSEVGVGTTFFIHLPLVKQSSQSDT